MKTDKTANKTNEKESPIRQNYKNRAAVKLPEK